MSQIFNALQKSEAERKGIPIAAPAVDELLREAESRFLSREDLLEQARPQNGLELNGDGSPPHEATGTSVPGGIEGRTGKFRSGRRADMNQYEFKTLSINPATEGRLVCVPGNESAAVEAFHLLGVRLRHLRRERLLNRLLITSTIPREGKSVAAANLACTLAGRTQQRTLLLEGDVRRPTQARIFGIHPEKGLCDWLRGGTSLTDCIYNLEGLDLYILPAGESSTLAPDVLEPAQITLLINQLEELFDTIIIDSPPMLPMADTSIWKNLADGVLLVTRQGVTEKRNLLRGLEAIEPQKLIGAIVNSSNLGDNGNYYYRAAPSTNTAATVSS